MPEPMGTLLSVNVGMPKDVPWQGKTVFTGVFKEAVTGPRRVRRLNVDGDGQGDLAGHGGEQRAVFVYQIDSYRYWERELGRSDFVYGQFGENFTVEGLSDDEVCIGDRYRIGTAVFEVTQPRVTCYRVGIRMNDPAHSRAARLAPPARLLLPRARRGRGRGGRRDHQARLGPGADDRRRGRRAPLPSRAPAPAAAPSAAHPRPQPGLASVVPRAARRRARRRQRRARGGQPATGLARVPPADRHRNRTRERLRDLHPPRGPRRRAAPTRASPASTSRCASGPTAEQRSVLRNYSLSGPPDAGYYRITVKREHDGAASGYLHTRLAVGDQLDIAAPRGTFILDRTAAPVLLISAGIGATPVLAMLHALAEEHSEREIWWLHGARSSRDHSFAAEARALLASLPNAHAHVCYSRPGPDDLEGRDFDSAGRLTASLLAELEPPRDAEAYLCGPAPFMEEISAGLAAIGIDASHIHTEPFGPAPGLTPGIAATPARTAPPARRARPETARRSSSRAATSRSRGATTTRACSSSPKHATFPSAGRAAPVSATTAKRRSSPAPSTTTPTRSNRPADGSALICCSQTARRRRRSTCDALGRPQPRCRATPGGWSAFSDAVFAITITLLVLEIRPPTDYTQSAARPRRALAVLSRLRGHVPVHRTGVGEPPRHVRPHPCSRPGRTAAEHPAADGRGVPSVRHLRPRRCAAQRRRPANRRRLLRHRVRPDGADVQRRLAVRAPSPAAQRRPRPCGRDSHRQALSARPGVAHDRRRCWAPCCPCSASS